MIFIVSKTVNKLANIYLFSVAAFENFLNSIKNLNLAKKKTTTNTKLELRDANVVVDAMSDSFQQWGF
jgi:hypothetical protein